MATSEQIVDAANPPIPKKSRNAIDALLCRSSEVSSSFALHIEKHRALVQKRKSTRVTIRLTERRMMMGQITSTYF